MFAWASPPGKLQAQVFRGENAVVNDTGWPVHETIKNLVVYFWRVLLQSPSSSWWLHAFPVALPSRRLDELNLSWCFEFTEKHVQAAVAHLSATITQLNLSGYRKNLQKAG